LTYANHFENGFHFNTITDNPYGRDLHNVSRFFTDASTFSVVRADQAYRPIVSTRRAQVREAIGEDRPA